MRGPVEPRDWSPSMNGEMMAMEYEKGRLLSYLPVIYADDPFLVGFLRLFESIWAPLERQIDQLYAYFDPRIVYK